MAGELALNTYEAYKLSGSSELYTIELYTIWLGERWNEFLFAQGEVYKPKYSNLPGTQHILLEDPGEWRKRMHDNYRFRFLGWLYKKVRGEAMA